MELKRIYARPEGWVKQVDAAGNCTNPPPLDYVALVHTGTSPEQKFTPDFLAANASFARIDGDRILLDVAPETLVYNIKRSPGRYCCHCGARLPDDDNGALARLHVATAHSNAQSPDAGNPGGYEKLNAFECTLDAQQHERFKWDPARGHRPHRRAGQE
jgi:hypothetical protein